MPPRQSIDGSKCVTGVLNGSRVQALPQYSGAVPNERLLIATYECVYACVVVSLLGASLLRSFGGITLHQFPQQSVLCGCISVTHVDVMVCRRGARECLRAKELYTKSNLRCWLLVSPLARHTCCRPDLALSTAVPRGCLCFCDRLQIAAAGKQRRFVCTSTRFENHNHRHDTLPTSI